ncbi:hypothetical protein [Tissierella praeacuta]|uniref:hypothetical protein n=1 Tax=Tissierella praeacuta TaxID=43131 RepID=UPI00093263AC|nr:hypothetical protein [Tissierella praeacuta]
MVIRKNNLSGILEKTLGQIREKKKKIKIATTGFRNPNVPNMIPTILKAKENTIFIFIRLMTNLDISINSTILIKSSCINTTLAVLIAKLVPP